MRYEGSVGLGIFCVLFLCLPVPLGGLFFREKLEEHAAKSELKDIIGAVQEAVELAREQTRRTGESHRLVFSLPGKPAWIEVVRTPDREACRGRHAVQPDPGMIQGLALFSFGEGVTFEVAPTVDEYCWLGGWGESGVMPIHLISLHFREDLEFGGHPSWVEIIIRLTRNSKRARISLSGYRGPYNPVRSSDVLMTETLALQDMRLHQIAR